MASDIQPVLAKAQPADYAFLVATLASPINFSRDNVLRSKLEKFTAEPTPQNREALTKQIERGVRYLGSSDIMYFARWALRREGGVEMNEVIRDVAARLNVQFKPVGTVEARLERLVRAVVERTVLNMTEDEQRQLFETHQIGPDVQDELIRLIREKGRFALLPILLNVLGKQAVEKLVPGIIVSLIGAIVGKEVAKQIVAALVTRFPLWAQWLGPVAWGASGAWFALDLQAPAYRKTIPLTLYCGIIALRDGPEEGDSFWLESAP